jgi:hypothetical protein
VEQEQLTLLGPLIVVCPFQGRIQDFKLGGAHLKKLRRAEGGAKIFGVFRVKNHDFTPKNHIFSNFREARAGCASPLDPALLSPFFFWTLCCLSFELWILITSLWYLQTLE